MTQHDSLDTPLVPLPSDVLCGEKGCLRPGANMVKVGDRYEFRCTEHTPVPPLLAPPVGAE